VALFEGFWCHAALDNGEDLPLYAGEICSFIPNAACKSHGGCSSRHSVVAAPDTQLRQMQEPKDVCSSQAAPYASEAILRSSSPLPICQSCLPQSCPQLPGALASSSLVLKQTRLGQRPGGQPQVAGDLVFCFQIQPVILNRPGRGPLRGSRHVHSEKLLGLEYSSQVAGLSLVITFS
jgi:hypothetical protein